MTTLIEALIFSLRRGGNELTRPNTLQRLSTLDQAQLKEVCRRVQNFKPNIAPAWSHHDVATLIATWRKFG